jgi:hypothetical protein
MIDLQYILDANCFIESAKQWYPFDIFPGFWDALIQKHREGKVFTLDVIEKEIKDGDVKAWLQNDTHFRDSFVLKENKDNNVLTSYGEIVQWAEINPPFDRKNKDIFASGADGWLVAYAKTNNMIVVTQETLTDNQSKKIKIPNVCKQFNVEYINLFEMLKRLDVKFILER